MASVIVDSLPASTKHKMRTFMYEPAGGRHFSDCRDGTLIFEDSKRFDTPGNDRDYTSYAVEEVVSESPGTHRVFLIERTAGIVDEPGPYEVAIPNRPGFPATFPKNRQAPYRTRASIVVPICSPSDSRPGSQLVAGFWSGSLGN